LIRGVATGLGVEVDRQGETALLWSACHEQFYALLDVEDLKRDMLNQFDAHLHNQHRRRWDANESKKSAITPVNE
jgi:hypothetical protein